MGKESSSTPSSPSSSTPSPPSSSTPSTPSSSNTSTPSSSTTSPPSSSTSKPSSGSTSSSKREATVTVGKDAFGKPVCQKEKEEAQCHESHEPYQKKTGGDGCGVKESSKGKSDKGNEASQSISVKDKETITSETGKEKDVKKSSQTFSEVDSVNGRKSPFVIPSKRFQLMGRWAPTAGLYIASTAVLAAWVTEWDAVLKHIPFYRPKEEVSQSSTLTIGANEGNGESSSTIADYEGNGENPSSIAKEGNGGSTSS